MHWNFDNDQEKDKQEKYSGNNLHREIGDKGFMEDLSLNKSIDKS